jgi:hypothetical protein
MAWHAVSAESNPSASSGGTAIEVGDDGVPAFDFTPGSAPGGGEGEPATRPARPRKHPLAEIAKVVAGGLLAIPVALMILLWLPGRWQRDPLGIGPTIGKTLPWAVPANLRPAPSAAPSAGEAVARDDQKVRSAQARPANSKRIVRREAKSDSASSADTDGAAEGGGDTASAAGADGEKPAAEAPARDVTRDRKQPEDTTQPRRGAADAQSDAPPDDQQPASPVGGEKPRTAAELRAALQSLVLANAAWDASSGTAGPARSELADKLFGALAQLGEIITFVDPRGPGVRTHVEAMQRLLMSVAGKPAKLAALGNRAASWLDQEQRDTEGIVLFGTVGRVRPRGPFFETELELAARQRRTVTVVSKVDPRGAYEVSDRVLVLGVIVVDPTANLLGYAGDEPLVVMGGFPLTLGR